MEMPERIWAVIWDKPEVTRGVVGFWADEPSEDVTEYVTKAHCDALIAENERMREALTPSCDTKAAYMSEFSMSFPEYDEDGRDYMREINIPWTTVKEIMAAISARAALTGDSDND